MSLVFDAVWAVVLVSTSRAVAGRLHAVPIGAVISLAAGGAGVAAGVAGQLLLDATARGAGSAAVFALTSFLVMLTAVAVLGLLAPARRVAGDPAPAGIPHPLRAVQARFARWVRYGGLLRLAARHGLGPLAAASVGKRRSPRRWARRCGMHRRMRAASSSSSGSPCRRAPTCCRRSSRGRCPAARPGAAGPLIHGPPDGGQ